nr:hypothetical protein [uncultured Cohaesibacter sp.]
MDKDHPIVLRCEELTPGCLGRMQMHANRAGGDLDHCDPDRTNHTKWYREIGNENFAKGVREEIRVMSKLNLDRELEALDRLNRKADKKRRQKEGLCDPFRASKGGPLREVLLTANAEYFIAEENDPNPYVAHRTSKNGVKERLLLSRKKVAAFERHGLKFFKDHFPGQLRYLRLDMDEEVPHFHALVLVKSIKESGRRGKQVMIQPSTNPYIRNYEWAQNAAGEFFSTIGLVRGERRAEARRKAKELDNPAPEDREHVSPAEHRAKRAEAIRQKEVDAEERFLKASQKLDEATQIANDAEVRAEILIEDASVASDDMLCEAQEAKQEADARLTATKGIAEGTIVADLTNAEEPSKVAKDADSDKAKPLLAAIKTSPKAAIDATKALRAAFRPLKNKLDAQLAAIEWVSEECGTVDHSREGNEFRVAENTDKQTADTLLSRIRLAPKTALGAVMPLVNILKRTKQAENAAIVGSAAVFTAAEGLFDFDADKPNDGFIALNGANPERVKGLEVRMKLDKRLASRVGRAVNATINRAVKDKAKKAEQRAQTAESRWNKAYEQIAGIVRSARDYMHPSDYDKFRRKAALVVNNADQFANQTDQQERPQGTRSR